MFLKENQVKMDRRYQPQKIFIQGMKDAPSLSQIEDDLLDYFSMFGNVIDSKILRNGKIMRPKQSVRLHDF